MVTYAILNFGILGFRIQQRCSIIPKTLGLSWGSGLMDPALTAS